MAAPTTVEHPPATNRRRRVRHKIQTPAYAAFGAESQGAVLDLHEVLNISEEGVAIHCHTPLIIGSRHDLCLDLAECPDQIYTTGYVIWSNAEGCSGLQFAELPPLSLFRLREWLFVNAVSAAADADDAPAAASVAAARVPHRPSYTDLLATVSAIQREVEALGADLARALELIAARAQSLLQASGAAIALTDPDPQFMICRASSGADAPPIGARLQIGSGFSGECVKSGRLLRCDDAENDPRVDRESCRALGIRSLLAVPVRGGDKSIAILEAFSARAAAFGDSDDRVVQRLAETVLAAINRAARAENLPPLEAKPKPVPFAPAGGVLFASEPVADEKTESADSRASGGVSLPRSHLILLISALAVTALALGFLSAPLIQSKLLSRGHIPIPTVLASSQAPKSQNAAAGPSVESVSIEQIRQMADKGDAAAQNSLGLLYSQGDDKDGIHQDEAQAFHWFLKAAEQGNVAAQSKLGAMYWAGRGVAVSYPEAYFWSILARANGDQASKDRAITLSAGLTQAQMVKIEQQAELWLQRRQLQPKPDTVR